MSDTFVTPEGLRLRVVGNNLLVRADPLPTESAGGILLTRPETMYGTGEVLAVGYLTGTHAPEHTPVPDVKVGDRVYYVHLLAVTDSNPQIKRLLEDNVLRIRASDVLLLLDADDLKRLR